MTTDESTDGVRAKAGGSKSASAFRTISEVSVELDVPQHVLRFWETKFPQIKPLKRGGGRRYYRPDDVELLRRIQILLYQDGYTIKGVQKLLRESRGLAGLPPPGTRMPTLFDADEAGDDPDHPESEEGAETGAETDENADDPATEVRPAAPPLSRPALSPELRQVLSETLMDLLTVRRLLD